MRILWEQARAPDAARYEVDRLLRGLAQPLAPGEDARDRADLLHLILDDPRLRDFRGSNGRRVEAVAARALVALGHPYALELAPESLEAMHEDEREDRSFIIYDDAPEQVPEQAGESQPIDDLSPRQKVGWLVSAGVWAVETLMVLFFAHKAPRLLAVGVLLVGFTTLLPTLVATVGVGLRNAILHGFCISLVALPSLVWLFVGSIVSSGSYFSANFPLSVLPLALVLARLVAPICLYGPRPERKPLKLTAEGRDP